MMRLGASAALVVAGSCFASLAWADPPAPQPPASSSPPAPVVSAPSATPVDAERYKVDVDLRAAESGDTYSVDVAGIGRCTTPCTLRGFPGTWDVSASGPAQFETTVFVPATGARLELRRRHEARTFARALGTAIMIAGAAAFGAGFVWLDVDANSQSHPNKLAPALVTIGGAAAFFYPGFVLFASGEGFGSDAAVVVPRGAAAKHPLRLVGFGAGETDRRTFVPSLTFEFD
jgi:hypothetical protein